MAAPVRVVAVNGKAPFRTESGWRSSVLRFGNSPFPQRERGNEGRRLNADGESVDPQAADERAQAQHRAGVAAIAAEARRLHARLYDHAEEAELGVAQGRQGAAYQRLRGDRLHPGRGP